MRKTYGTMVFINVMWGLSFIFSKQGMNAGFQPMGLAFVRYVLAAAALIPLLLWRRELRACAGRTCCPCFSLPWLALQCIISVSTTASSAPPR